MIHFPENIQAGLKNMGITQLNLLQEECLKVISKEKEVVILSPTGSGKTLAFALPILSEINPNYTNKIQALILAPSRELAQQIEQVIKATRSGFKVNCFFGGHEMRFEKQSLTQPPHVLIGTPGRIADHFRRGTINGKSIEFLVIDEFDKSLEIGFKDDLSYIRTQLPNLKKKVLTSATAMNEIPDYILDGKPKFIHNKVDSEQSEKRSIFLVEAPQAKEVVLHKLLKALTNEPTLVFCNFKETVGEIERFLRKQGIELVSFHGGLEQKDREKNLVQFRNRSVNVLVTTDLAARGLDIPEIKHVIHLQLPVHEAEFIHRNGRTARMHKEGSVYVIKGKDFFHKDYLPKNMVSFDFNKKIETKTEANIEFVTLYISKGKKDKLRKLDIVGYAIQTGGLEKEDLGLIEVKDAFSYIAVNKEKADNLIKKAKQVKLKNIQVQIGYVK